MELKNNQSLIWLGYLIAGGLLLSPLFIFGILLGGTLIGIQIWDTKRASQKEKFYSSGKNKVTYTKMLKEYWSKNKISLIIVIFFVLVIGPIVLKNNNLIDLDNLFNKGIENKTLSEENSERDDFSNISKKNIKKESKEFSLDELLKLSYFDHDKFDSYALEKGYYFDYTDKTDDAWVFNYLSKENKNQSDDFRLIAFTDFIPEDHWALSSCTYRTGEKKEYVDIKEQLQQNGFVYSGSRMFDESTMLLIYEKGKIDVILSTLNYDMNNGETKNFYKIEINLFRNSD